MLNRVWHLWNGGPLVVGFHPDHHPPGVMAPGKAGWNLDWCCIMEPYDWYSYVVLPHG